MSGVDWQARFEAAQRDDEFLGWVAINEGVLELEFAVDDVPDLTDRPWGVEELQVAEAAALERFASREVTFDGPHADAAWRFVRFVGQVFADAFGGRWVNIPDSNRGGTYPGVQLPFRNSFIEPIGLLTAAMSRRTGREWAKVFRYAEEDQQAAAAR